MVLSPAKTFAHPTHRPNELWQTDFTYLPVVGWGWYYLSTVLDDYSRYILAWTLRTSMQASDVTETLDLARARAWVDRVRVVHRPRLLSDNGPCYISQELADYLDTHGLAHTRGAPYHPMTQGKIERDHRSMKNVVKLEKCVHVTISSKNGLLSDDALNRPGASARILISSVYKKCGCTSRGLIDDRHPPAAVAPPDASLERRVRAYRPARLLL